MKALLLARLLSWYRQLKSQAFELFVLGPIVLGGALAIADRYLMVGAPFLAQLLMDETSARRLGLLAAFLFSALAAGGVFRELYGERAGPGLLDILPVSEPRRLVLTAIAAPVAALPAALLWTAGGHGLAYWLGKNPVSPLRTLIFSWVAFLALVLLDHLLIQLAMRLRLLRALPLAAAIAALAAAWALAPLSPLLLPWRLAGDLLAQQWALNAGTWHEAEPRPFAALLVFAAAGAAALFLLYRRRDLAPAQALVANARALRLLPAFRRPWAALVRRDLLLVLRRFSPLVPLAFAASVALLALLPLLVSRSGLAPLPLARTFAAGGVLAAAAWVALLPYLLAGQLRTFWLESSLGATAAQLGRAKAATSLLLAAPAALVASALALALLPSEAGLTAIAILCGALTLSVSMGLTIWETPLEPAIGLIYGLLVGGAAAALFVLAPVGWPFWLAAYGYLAAQLLGRVRQQVASLEQPR